MSKKGFIYRYLLILKKIKQKPYSSYEEIERYLMREFEFMQLKDDSITVGFSKRTFQRDIKEIRNIFGFDIEFSKKTKGYSISENESESASFSNLLEAFDLFNSLNIAHDLQPLVFVEKKNGSGAENLYGLLHAIKNKLKIKFQYEKFWENEITIRHTSPIALKEFKNRWYLLAMDEKDHKIKSFALDRLSDLEITDQKFKVNNEHNIALNYQHCYGIIQPLDGQPEEVILSFEPTQGKYIKSLPLHSSQQILLDDGKQFQIKLKLFITEDFIMELLSHGNRIKVLQPKSLVDEMKTILFDAYKQY
jgi:predicted DNA-binding transcriptional regulator YafY